MGQQLDFTGTFELRRPGTAGPAVAVVATTGTMTVPDNFLPTTGPAPGPVTLGSRVRLGAFVYHGIPGGGGAGDPWDPTPHLALEQVLGRRLSPVSTFIGWDTDFPSAQFAAYGDRDLLISWHPTNATAADILAGHWNSYLDRWGQAIEAYRGGIVHIRPMPEMNGSWSAWSPANPTGIGIANPAMFLHVWRYIVTRVRTHTTKARWVFCPNVTDEPARDGNRLEQFYPGAGYVDVLGFDGYNWGTWGSGQGKWTPFSDLLGKPQGGASRSIYDRLAALHPTAPIWVCEFGSKEPTVDDGRDPGAAVADPGLSPPDPGQSPPDPGQSKAAWYAAALRLTGFPRLTTLVAFDMIKERDWRIQSSPDVAAAIQANLT